MLYDSTADSDSLSTLKGMSQELPNLPYKNVFPRINEIAILKQQHLRNVAVVLTLFLCLYVLCDSET